MSLITLGYLITVMNVFFAFISLFRTASKYSESKIFKQYRDSVYGTINSTSNSDIYNEEINTMYFSKMVREQILT